MKKVRILILSIIFIVILAGIAILIVSKNYSINKTQLEKQAQEEQEKEGIELVSLKVDINQETDESYKCLLTFIANNKDDKIKSIEYPSEEGKEIKTIQIEDEDGRDKVGIDYEINKNKQYGKFKVTTLKNNIIELTPLYKIKFKVLNEIINEVNVAKGGNYNINEQPEKENYTFYGWTKDEKAYIAEYTNKYFYEKNDDEVILNAIMREDKNIAKISLINAVEEINSTCQANITVEDETYTTDFMVYNEDLVLDGSKQINGAILNENVYEFGNEFTDVATETKDARNMVILKVNGNLTINQGISLTTCKDVNGYGGPKGVFIYCTGIIKNDGIIDMTARGTRAEGQNVYLWKNSNNSYEYVPSSGAEGGLSAINWASNIGTNGTGRQTAGGGSGAGRSDGRGGAGRYRYFILRRYWWWPEDMEIQWENGMEQQEQLMVEQEEMDVEDNQDIKI